MKIRVIRTVKVNIQYDYFLKYSKECKLQDHNMYECRVIHLELANTNEDYKTDAGSHMGADDKSKDDGNDKQLHGNNKGGSMQQSQPSGSFPRRLTSGKIVGNPEDWNEVTNKKA